MNATLVANWNATVGARDLVYVLGDIWLGNPKFAMGTLGQLNGAIRLVRGNHDKPNNLKQYEHRFEWIKDYFELRHNGNLIVMSHYPMMSWNGSYRGSIMLHGHCHGNVPSAGARRLDVGVDSHNYAPLLLDDIIRGFITDP
jgi:calcineurin-like phosphoesterase family protein